MLPWVEVVEENTAAGVVTLRSVSGGMLPDLYHPTAQLPQMVFKVADSPATDRNSPIVAPSGASVTRTYEKWVRLKLFNLYSAAQVSSPKFYTSGVSNLGNGVTLYARTTNAGSYSTPAVPANDSAGTNAFTYTSASPKALDAVNAGPFSSPGLIGDYLVLWLTFTSSVGNRGKFEDFMLPPGTLYFTWS